MNLIFSSKGIELTEAMKQYAAKKFGKIEKICPRISEIKINFRVEKYRQIVDAVTSLGQETIKISKESKDIYSSVDMAYDLFERKIRRFKEKLSSGKNTPSTQPSKKAADNRLIYKSYTIKPMHIEDALMKLDSDDKPFVVFENAETLKTSILYKDKNERICIIETV